MPGENVRIGENPWHSRFIPASGVLLYQTIKGYRPGDSISDMETQLASTESEVAKVANIRTYLLRQIGDGGCWATRARFPGVSSDQVWILGS